MNKKIKIISAVLVFWVALFIAWEWWYSFPKVRIIPTTEVTSEAEGIDSIVTHAMSNYLLPGISVAIVRNDKLYYLNAFGYSNLETKDSLTVESEIIVASVSKLFTAIGLAEALQAKGIQVNDPVSALGLGEKINSTSLAKVRFQDLLSHQSGLRDKTFSEMIFSFSSRSQSLDEWGTAFLENTATYHSDSTSYNYADSNYDLLGFLLSRSENLEFHTHLQNSVLDPSGMEGSGFVSEWPSIEEGITGYQRTFLWKRIVPKRIKFPTLPSPSAGLVSTTKDMSSALIHLLRAERGAYRQALEWLSIEGTKVPVGFQKTQINGSEWIGHFGGQAGYASLLFYSKEADTGIFLFSNSRDKDDFRIEIARQIISYISK
ncbi:serine hydrolase domain-containing protein [Algoriphagus chordae]|uniref:CubicO group peptidase (Beta-lactamase class C family) n=1 Tax=Algoriphagus chordae TaxID=237019 RepID=A0A2W7QMH4_9BACT|nr:serine hydrolase domain-containing protein [Algoriphagus chordae]PZX49653.1 CubicO group peptidase (beta-lactamase class C family) [Algoriphagus chordae]